MASLDDIKIHVRLKLGALWAATMSCYIYCDYFELYVPGKLQSMLDGRMDPLGPTTQGILFGTATMMALPSLMIALSLLLPAAICRWANIVLGLFYTAIMCLLVYQASWYFYKGFAALEALMTAAIVVYAWRWPRMRTASRL